MIYYSIEMNQKMQGTKEDEILQKHFPNNKDWGACLILGLDKKQHHIEICKLTQCEDGKTQWEHFAQVVNDGDGKWEVSTLFNGEKKDEMWIFAYYKRFGDAIDFIASGKIETSKPIMVYK